MTSARHLPTDGEPALRGPGTPRLQLLGPLRLWRGDHELDAGPRRQRCLLALLMAREGHPVSTSDLIGLIWGPDTPAHAANVVHKYVGVLRRLLEPDLPPRTSGSFLVRHGNGYRFTADAGTLDLIAFRRLVAQAKTSVSQGRPENALEHYARALPLCHGNVGEALAGSAGATAVFARIDHEFFEAAVCAADVAVRLGRPSLVLAPLRLAARMSRFNEPVHARLIVALAALGLQDEALSVFQEIRARLSDDLGIDPGHDLREAHRRVLAQAVPSAKTAGSHDALPGERDALPGEHDALPGEHDALPGELDDPRPVSLVRPAQLPPGLPPLVGRAPELEMLTTSLGRMRADRRTGPLVVALDGMGGVGKSTLAAHFAHAIAGEFADGQLYLDLRGDRCERGGLTAGDALGSLLHALGVPASNMPDTFDARLGTYRSLTAGKRFLLLLDDVRDAAQVRPLLPNSAGGLVVITSRRRLAGLAAFDGAHLLRVDVPDHAAARELLVRRLAGQTATGQAVTGQAAREAVHTAGRSMVDEIVELCGRLPLALTILAERLTAGPASSLEDAVSELRDEVRRLGALSGGRDVPDLRTAFSWSYRRLSAEAARLFRLTALALGPGVTAEACVSLSGREPRSTRAALAELTEAALVTEDDTGRFSSHVLVRAYARELLLAGESVMERDTATGRLLQHYLHSSLNAQALLRPHRAPAVAPPPPPGVVPECPATYDEAIAWFAGHRQVLVEAVPLTAGIGCGAAPWQLAISMQHYLQRAGCFQEWEDVMRAALYAARQEHDVIGEAHVLRGLAGARFSVGARDEAIGLLTAALSIYVEHGMALEQGLVHSNLCGVHDAAGRDEAALEHGEKAVELYRIAGDRRAESIGLWGRGRALARLGRVAESAEVLERGLSLTLRLVSTQVESEIRNDVAGDLVRLGRTAAALEHLRADPRGAAGRSPRKGGLTDVVPPGVRP
ncbi:BTAD domain-containing putative transcriptional regulator [Streptosporangium sp. NPDC048865]|uniref:AfsR/SARP family transcriptional regulator n=1 Tax=Streptosporangium sp. NPDC048865 TaxID=3155766 RepID=UPI003443B6A6